MFLIPRNIFRIPRNSYPKLLRTNWAIVDLTILAALWKTRIRMNKKFGSYRHLLIDNLIHSRNFIVHLGKVKVTGKCEMAIYMEFVPIALYTKIMDINPFIFPIALQDFNNILHECCILFIHQSTDRLAK